MLSRACCHSIRRQGDIDSSLTSDDGPGGPATQHKVFLSYHHSDADEAAAFVHEFASAFESALTVGVSDSDSLMPTGDEARLLRRIAEKYLADSDITIVLVGSTTWTRRFVDWEIAATTCVDRALLIVLLPEFTAADRLPPRVIESPDRIAVRSYPASAVQLRQWIAEATATPRPRLVQAPLMRRDHPSGRER